MRFGVSLMGFSEIQLLKKLGEQFNIVIVSIGSILVYLVVYGTPGVSRKARWICAISSCVFSNLVFVWSLMMKPA